MDSLTIKTSKKEIMMWTEKKNLQNLVVWMTAVKSSDVLNMYDGEGSTTFSCLCNSEPCYFKKILFEADEFSSQKET